MTGKNQIMYPKMTRQTFAMPIVDSQIQAGFPSPAEDLPIGELDIVSFLIRNPAATFFLRVSGESMINAGIFDGDLLIVDRSITPVSGDIIVAVLHGEFTVKRLQKKNGIVELLPENPKYSVIRITDTSEFEVWGVVTKVIKSF